MGFSNTFLNIILFLIAQSRKQTAHFFFDRFYSIKLIIFNEKN